MGWILTITESPAPATAVPRDQTRELTEDATTGLLPSTSLAALEKEVNALIWNAMKLKKDFKQGFELTDTNEDGDINREEDTAANVLAAHFKELDSYTPYVAPVTAVTADPSATPPVVGVTGVTEVYAEEKKDEKLDRWELNTKYPMWQVDNLLKSYGGTSMDHLDILSFAQS
jgi:hypothetical protein